MDQESKQQLVESIYAIDKELVSQKIALKQTQQEILIRIDRLNSYQFIQEAKEQLRALETQLKIDIENDGEIVALKDQEAKIRADIHDVQETLSLNLIRYYVVTEDSMVPLPGKAKMLIVSAKLGKEQPYQERLI